MNGKIEDKTRVKGKKKIENGENYMVMGMLIGLCVGMVMRNDNSGYIIGMCLGMLVGSLINKEVSNDDKEYLECLKQETEDLNEYLQESEYIDYSDEDIRKLTDNLLEPVNQIIWSRYTPYIEAIIRYREKPYTTDKFYGDEDEAFMRMFEHDNPQIFKRMKKKETVNYWKNVKKGVNEWQDMVVERLFTYVRDEVKHSLDINAEVVTAKASDVLKYNTGICHAKANLLAAMLRYAGIPVGLCFERLAWANGPEYCIHGFNAVYIHKKWVFIDARGNTNGVNAQFHDGKSTLAFYCRKELDEYFFDMIYTKPNQGVMDCLEKSKTMDDIRKNLPDKIQ